MQSKLTKPEILKWLTVIVAFLSVVQGVVPSMPIDNENTVKIVSGAILLLVTIATIWKQFFSKEIRNGSLVPTIILAVTAMLGAGNEFLNVVHLSESTSQWIRLGLTVSMASLNILSKIIWPTDETISKI